VEYRSGGMMDGDSDHSVVTDKWTSN